MTTRLILSLQAKSLKNASSKLYKVSDPFAVVSVIESNGKRNVLGSTEIVFNLREEFRFLFTSHYSCYPSLRHRHFTTENRVLNTLSPDWKKVFNLEYDESRPMYFEVEIFDDGTKKELYEDGNGIFFADTECERKRGVKKLDSEQLILISRTQITDNKRPMGMAQFEIGEILSMPEQSLAKKSSEGGKIIAQVERSNGTAGVLSLQLRGMQLKNARKTFMRTIRSNPYFEIMRKVDMPSGEIWIVVYRSNVRMNHLNPLWQEGKIDLESLCNGDLDRMIRIVVRDFLGSRRGNKQSSMGSFETTVRHLIESKAEFGNGDQTKAYTLMQGVLEEVGKIVVLEAQTFAEESKPLEHEAVTP